MTFLLMTTNRSSEETTVFAIYSTRRDAEMARESLSNAGIEAFIRADDAGGMHPQLQRPHGVKLVGMSSSAQEAYQVLEEADLLPETIEDRSDAEFEDRVDEAEPLTFSMKGTAGILGLAAVVLIILYFLLV